MHELLEWYIGIGGGDDDSVEAALDLILEVPLWWNVIRLLASAAFVLQLSSPPCNPTTIRNSLQCSHTEFGTRSGQICWRAHLAVLILLPECKLRLAPQGGQALCSV